MTQYIFGLIFEINWMIRNNQYFTYRI